MLIAVWSPKGGSGTSSVATVIAAIVAKMHPDVRLVDVGGDVPAVCGIRLPVRHGVRELFVADREIDRHAFDALTVDVSERFRVIPAGRAALQSAVLERGAAIARSMRLALPLFIVDVGCVAAPALAPLVRSADLSLMVVRPCFVALQRATREVDLVERTSGLICVTEPGRALGTRDIAAVLGRPIFSEFEADPDVARSIDAGLLLRREPHAVFGPLTRMCRRLGLAAINEDAA